MSTFALCVLVLGFQEPKDSTARIEQLVNQVRVLLPDATRRDFLNRPAMSRLMALGPAVVPHLKKVFLTDDDWSIKASVGYLLITMVQSRDPEITRRWTSLLDDPNPFVRGTMALLADQFVTGCVTRPLVLKPDAQTVLDRLQLRASVHWMAPDDLKSLVMNCLAIIEAGKPLLDPPAWDIYPGGRTLEGRHAERLRSAGCRVITPQASLARLSLHRVFASPGAHDALQLVMESAEKDDGSDQPRLGLKLRLAIEAVGHQGETCSNGACPLKETYQFRLHRACEKWAWKATDRNAQYGIIRALYGVGLWKAHDLLERMSKEHPDAQVKELAGNRLNSYWNGMLDSGHTRELEKAAEERLKQ